MNLYRYGMKRQGYGKGNQPQTGFYIVDRNLENFGKYHDIIIYKRKLTADEVRVFDLDFLGKVK